MVDGCPPGKAVRDEDTVAEFGEAGRAKRRSRRRKRRKTLSCPPAHWGLDLRRTPDPGRPPELGALPLTAHPAAATRESLKELVSQAPSANHSRQSGGRRKVNGNDGAQ